LAAFPTMMKNGRRREGLRECRAAWLIGVTIRRYRELEAGESSPTPDEWQRMVEMFKWPRSFSH
jgi:hypothetical protein